MLADSLGAEAETRYSVGDFAEMIDLLEQALAINEKIGNQWGQSYARTLLAIVHFHRGEPDLAIEMGTRGITLGDEGGLLATSISIRCDLAWMYGCFGSTERGLLMAGQALEIAMAKQPDWQALPTAILVRLYLLAEDPEAAELTAGPDPLESVPIPYPHYTILLGLANVEMALSKSDYASALAFVDAIQAEVPAFYRPGTDEVLYHKAQALFGLGRLAEAREILVKARSSAESLGSNQVLWSILGLLAELEAQAGNAKEAAKLRDQARRIVLAIADRLQASGLREDFLGRPQVSALFAVVPKT
jgi:tetratricopeptide (TPR) repeat protein